MMNPFDDNDATYVALRNEEGQYSLWPSVNKVPQGWRIVHQEDKRQGCLDYINQNWTDMRPLSLIKATSNQA